jgi:chromatin remodeling complex protein RSC6
MDNTNNFGRDVMQLPLGLVNSLAQNSKELEQSNSDDEANVSYLPLKLQKIVSKMGSLKTRLHENKREATQLCIEVNAIEKMMDQYVMKLSKEQQKSAREKRQRKPSGFASPTKVSPELCVFMGRPVGELISRTETSKFLSEYISSNQLFDPLNKTIIRPNEQLSRLLGETARDNEITYFTIQKYMNRHFTENISISEQIHAYSH